MLVDEVATKFEFVASSPLYTAVILCVPTVAPMLKLLVVNVAVLVLPLPLRRPVPIAVPASSKVTVPPGVAELLLSVFVTVAVNVTVCVVEVEANAVWSAVGSNDATVVVVLAWATVCGKVSVVVLPLKFVSPP